MIVGQKKDSSSKMESSKWSGLMVYPLAVFLGISACGFLESKVSPNENGETLHPALIKENCPNLEGTYQYFGKPLPGMPNYFRIYSIRLTPDVLLGISLGNQIKRNISQVRVEQKGTLKFLFLDKLREVGKGDAFRLEEDSVACKDSKLIIKKTLKTRGAFIPGTANVTHEISLDASKSLIIETEIINNNWFLFIPYTNDPENYAARFDRIIL